jgi:hypothetical protein
VKTRKKNQQIISIAVFLVSGFLATLSFLLFVYSDNLNGKMIAGLGIVGFGTVAFIAFVSAILSYNTTYLTDYHLFLTTAAGEVEAFTTEDLAELNSLIAGINNARVNRPLSNDRTGNP